jgi:hypothetical protein
MVVICGTLEYELVYAWDMHGEELCNYWIRMYWFVAIDVLGGATGINLRQDKDTPWVEQVGGFHLFLVWC